jgi:hypothetical protein
VYTKPQGAAPVGRWTSGATRLDDVSEPVQLRVALAQVDTRVGDLSGNAELVAQWAARAE